MYSFGARPDTTAVDEPFYGAFLKKSGIAHPMASETMAAMVCDPVAVPEGLTQYPTPHQYEKHMAHHMLQDFPLGWMEDVRNVFLLRHPARVLASYVRKRESPTAEDLGFTQLETLFARCADPVVIESSDIRRNPRDTLSALCHALGLPFDPAMLSWSAGPKPFDGPWAPHWYDAVHRSTAFDAAEGPLPKVPQRYAAMVEAALEPYARMAQNALRS